MAKKAKSSEVQLCFFYRWMTKRGVVHQKTPSETAKFESKRQNALTGASQKTMNTLSSGSSGNGYR